MAAQKGPGEGYHAAKHDALKLDGSLTCAGVYYASAGSFARIIGYTVQRNGKTIGKGTIARDAWNEALSRLRTERGLDWRGEPVKREG